MNKPTGNHSDRRGHWKRGRRRNVRCRKLVDRLCTAVAFRISGREAARRLGVSDRTVRRWLQEEDIPSAEAQKAIAAMLAAMHRPVSAPGG